MLVLTSPAKTLDFETQYESLDLEFSQPQFKEYKDIVNKMTTLSKDDISSLMKISPELAELNYNRYQNFFSQQERAAIFAYDGDVFARLKRSIYDKEAYEFANKHILIISGLYGLLRPLDLIRPYRLEMSTKLEINKKKSLYQFWSQRLSQYIEDIHKGCKEKVIVNLASAEYSRILDLDILKGFEIINVKFLQAKGNRHVEVGVLAKRARGMMLDYIIQNKITEPDDLEDFAKRYYECVRFLTGPLGRVFYFTN